MPTLDEPACRTRLDASDHAVLCTVAPDGRPRPVPVCFAVVADLLAIPIDEVKPKAPGPLARQRDLAAGGAASLLVEHWDAGDWANLWWVRVGLTTVDVAPIERDRLETSLRDRYPAYRSPASTAAATAASQPPPFRDLLTFRIADLTGWTATAPDSP